MTLTVDIHIDAFTHLVYRIYQLWYHRLQQFLKKSIVLPFPIRKHKRPMWHCRNISQGQLRVIIWTKLVGTRAPDVAYQLSRSSAFWFRRERLFNVLSYMGIAAILVMWPGPFDQTFVPPSHGGSIWNLTLIGKAVSEDKMFKECGRRRKTDDDDGRRRTTTDGQRSLPLL